MTENGEALIDYEWLANKPDITSIENQLNNEMFRKLGVNPLTKYIEANGIEVTADNPADSPKNWEQIGTGCGVITQTSGKGDVAKITNYPWSVGEGHSAWLFNLCYRPDGEYGIIQILYAYDGNTGKKHNIYRRRGNVDGWYNEGWVKDFDSKDLIPLTNGGTNCDLSEASDYAIIRKGGPAANNSLRSVSTKSGALYATGDNKEPKFGTLPIAQGGTGAEDRREAALNINFLGSNPLYKCLVAKSITNPSNKHDTVENWREIGPGFAYIDGYDPEDTASSKEVDGYIIANMPTTYNSYLINYVPSNSNLCRQILMPFTIGAPVYVRYGSTSNTFTPWVKLLDNNGNQSITNGSIYLNNESTATGFIVRAPYTDSNKKTTNVESRLVIGTLNNDPCTVVVHSENGDIKNRLILRDDKTEFTQAVAISSGGTGAKTKADALANLGAMPKANFKLEGTTLTITL